MSSLALVVCLVGCASPPQADHAVEKKPLTLMALDTSGSASSSHAEMFDRATSLIQQIPEGQKLYLYRFDSSPAEVLSEEPPASTDGIAEILNEVLNHHSKTNGTNLGKLFNVMDKRISELKQPVNIVVFTDCGIEEMRKSEITHLKKLTSDWDHQDLISSVTFYGLNDDYRDQIRDMVAIGPAKLQILR